MQTNTETITQTMAIVKPVMHDVCKTPTKSKDISPIDVPALDLTRKQ